MENRVYYLFIVGLLSLFACGQNDGNGETVSQSTETEEPTVEKLDTATYAIMATEHYPAAENFYVLLKQSITHQDSLQKFVDKFRQEHCLIKCNINLYDDASVQPYIKKYPMPDKEYLLVADHYVAVSDFSVKDVFLYPYQDLKYKELGGKNWKKEPIQ